MSAFGRGSGGELYGYRKGLNYAEVNFRRVEESYVLDVKTNNSVLLICPIYLNASYWQRDYENLKEVLQNLRETNLMLIGDFNGRIGLSQNSFVSGYKKDEICDQKGRKILDLADAYDCSILNGSCEGDYCGEYTFIHGKACSIIDYCCISGNWNFLLSDFRIGTETFSDHMSLEVNCMVSRPTNERSIRQLGLLPKLVWNDRTRNMYRSNLNSELERLHTADILPDIDALTNMIKNAVPSLPTRKNKTPKQKWFDYECLGARNNSFKLLKLFREHNTNIFKILYGEANKNFKRICYEKKIKCEQQRIAIINNSTSSAEFWKAVKYINGQTNSIASSLRATQLRDHFINLLNSPQISPPPQYAAPLITDEFLDNPFSLEEIEEVFSKAKTRKAPGDDRIPYEFYKNCTYEFMSALVEEFNRIFDSANIPE